MRLIDHAASIVIIGAVLAYYGLLFAKEDDTQIIRQFIDLGWRRGQLDLGDRQPMIDWVRWCKAGMQLGEFGVCPPR